MRRLLAAGVMVVVLAGLPGAAGAAELGARAVAVVVDFGDTRAPLVLCEDGAGKSDAQVLSDALAAAGRGGLRFGPTGLLCGIDGYPASGCGSQSSAHYAYWAYFHGTPSGWTYAHEGPASHLATNGTAIGFRFESSGTGTPADPAPRASSDAAISCPVSVTSTTAVPSAPGVTSTTVQGSVSTTTMGVVTSSPPVHSATAAVHTAPSTGSGSAAPVALSIVGLLAAIGGVLAYTRLRGRRGA